MNGIENPETNDLPPSVEGKFTQVEERMRNLAKVLGATESAEMVELRFQIMTAASHELLIQLLTQYMQLGCDLIDQKNDPQEGLYARVGALLLDAAIYLMVGKMLEADVALQNASVAAPNLADQTIADMIDELFPN